MRKKPERRWIVRCEPGEKGSVLILALIMLVFLTLLGVASTTTTQIELQVAGNHHFHKVAFYNADSGVYTVPKIIRRTVDEAAQPTITGITYLDTVSGVFYREVMGYNAHDATKDIQFTLGGRLVQVDVERNRQISLAGGGVEFAAGAEGVGAGSTGGVAVIYRMASLGQGPAASLSGVTAEYRLVPGVAGGM